MKKCIVCGELLPLERFYRHPLMADGHLGKCKECQKENSRKNYRKNVGKRREYDRRREQTPERKAKKAEYQRRHRAKNPAKANARNTLTYHVRAGNIQKTPCPCGSVDVEAHHHDYSKPLDVKWLCFACHRALHGQEVD